MAKLPLLLAGLLVAAAVELGRAALTRDGVGVFEYAVSAVVVAALCLAAFRLTRSAIRRA